MSMSPDLRNAQAGFDGMWGSCPEQDERHKQDL